MKKLYTIIIGLAFCLQGAATGTATNGARASGGNGYHRAGWGQRASQRLTLRLAETRAHGNECGVGRSGEVSEEVGSSQAQKRKRKRPGTTQAEVP